MSSLEDIRDALGKYEGVPESWACLFYGMHFSVAEVVAWAETAVRDSNSPLSSVRNRDLNVSLREYAAARGVVLDECGDGDDMSSAKADRLTHWVSTVTTAEEQEMIIKEVGVYADVKFREKLTGVYTAHAVANAVRSVHQAYLRKLCASESSVLEAGASLKAAVLAGVDVTRYHACCPVLDVRDGARHSLRSWLTMVVSSTSKYKESIRAAAAAALDPDSGFVCKQCVQDCNRQVQVVCSNESTHDIAFNDLPKIMARHGARLWVGFMTRAPGVRRTGGPSSGKCSVLGTKWRVDREKDLIQFHFDKDSSFAYEHKFSEWICYEEKIGYRWRGRYFDYVYSRLPITTTSSLAFAVVRVPKTNTLLAEPVYQSSGLEGMVEVTSIKATGGCVGVVQPKFAPYTFHMEEVVFDRALETRLAQGERGNLGSTLSYLRSARVRLGVNGVALGAVKSVPVDDLEPAAVAIEFLAADKRMSGQRDYTEIMRVAADDGVTTKIASYFAGVTAKLSQPVTIITNALKDALLRVSDGSFPVVVKSVRCPSYVKVFDGCEFSTVEEVPKLTAQACGCDELLSIRSALTMGSALTKAERKELQTYERELSAIAKNCLVHKHNYVSEADADDVFHDAVESVSGISDETDDTGSAAVSGTTLRTSLSSECSCALLPLKHESCGLTAEIGFLDTDGMVRKPGSDCDSCGNDALRYESEAVKAIREYAYWTQAADKYRRTEAATWYDVLFQLGTPTIGDVERSTTARTRHGVLAVVDGRVKQITGTLREDDDYAEVYVPSLRRTTKVVKELCGSRYIKEPVTELCYTGTDLKVMNGDELCRKALSTLASLPPKFEIPRCKYVDGVPGAGKTYEIIQKCKASVTKGQHVLYVTQTLASKDEVEKAVRPFVGDRGSFTCLTADSFTMHGAKLPRGESFAVMFIDEAGMIHKGQQFVMMVKAGMPKTELYADSKQIPCVSFMPDFEFQHAVPCGEYDVERRDVTHRFGAKICAMWLDVYDSIYPCDCHDHVDDTPEVIHVGSASEVQLLETGKTLTFTQEEKVTVRREQGYLENLQVLKVKDNGGLSTVAEDQGGTHTDVNIIRVVNRNNPKESSESPSIYNKQPWVLVGTTRQRRKLRYYTLAPDDLVVARIALASCPIRVQAVLDRKTWSQVCDIAMHVRTFGV